MLGTSRFSIHNMKISISGILSSIALFIASHNSFCAEQYPPHLADPLPEAWRWTLFPELEGKGVRCVAQDQEGKMWFGTDKGVLEYNGYSWTLYPSPDSIAHENIEKIVIGKNGILYISTDSDVYALLDSKWTDILPQQSNLDIKIIDMIALPDKSLLIGFRGLEKVAGLLRIGENKSTIYASEHLRSDVFNEYIPEAEWKIIPDDFTIGSNKIFQVSDLYFGHEETVYVGVSSQESGKIITFKFDSSTVELKPSKIHSQKDGLNIRGPIEITQSIDGKIWVVSRAHEMGVNTYDKSGWKEIRLSEQFGGVNSQNSILACSDGSIWIEGHGRIFLFRDEQWTVYQYPDIPISTASRFFFYESNDNNIWVLGKLSEVYKFEYTSKSWTTYQDLNFQFETESGAKWYLSVNGETVVNLNETWTSFGLADGLIDTPVRLFLMSYGEIWAIGSHDQVAASAYFDGKEWHKTVYPKVSWGFDHRGVYESRDGSLWLGSSIDLQPERGHQGGIIRYMNPHKKDEWIHYSDEDGVSIQGCYGIGESKNGLIWFGGKPLWVFDGSSWTVFDEINPLREHVDYMHNDEAGNLWLGSRYYGVFRFDGRHWSQFTIDDGLPSNNILSIYAEDENNIWVLTYDGASHYDGERWTSNLFPDALMDNPEGSGLIKSRSGEIWFNHSTNDWKRRSLTYPVTTQNTSNHFHAIKNIPDKSPPETQITAYSRKVDESGDNVVFWKGNDYYEITQSADLQFSWSLNDGSWSKFSTNNYHKFSQLKPGGYIFKVRARDHEFNIDPTPAVVQFTVLASWWKRPGFISMASLVTFIIGFLIWRLFKHYRKLQLLNLKLEKNTNQLKKQNHKIETQRDRLSKTVEKVNRLSQSRLQFFTNVSHEFRTPLSLIMGPIEELKNNHSKINKTLREKYYYIIHRNANRLLKLINQILEVYKIEDSTLEFKPKSGDLLSFIQEIVGLFDTLAKQRHIDLKVETFEDSIQVCFDSDKIEKIVFNLLSNAFKNVPYGGKIHVRLSLDSIDTTDISETETDKVVKIEVSDNGKGIPQELLIKIFDRFFHVDNEEDRELHVGTGIGLSYIKDLVRTHQGSVNVMSQPGKVTTFTVIIPYLTDTNAYLSNPCTDSNDNFTSDIHSALEDLKRSFEDESQGTFNKSEEITDESVAKLLIVEDESDSRTFLRHAFNDIYVILEAKNGIEGLNIANKEFPDLIISDVMMPEMDGIELCRKIKSDFNTSHIPVVLLTAKTQSEDKIVGYNTGADGYVEKPYNVKLLQSRVSTIIRNRQLLIQRFQTDIDLEPKQMQIASLDEKFIQRAIAAVEKYMDDSTLDAEKLAHEIGVSRIQLYRKIKALANQTVNEFIKSIRLKHAARLLLEDQLNISQIAYSTGFAAPNHFATYFRKHFGVTPSEYAQKSPE